jgi:hypothetical protein
MSEDARQGRTVLLWFLSGMVLMSLAVIAFYISVKGAGKLHTQSVRFALTIGLCYWVWSGSLWAKRILLFLSLLTAVSTIVLRIVLDNALAVALLAAMGNFYFSVGLMLLKNTQVNEFLAYQRGEAHQPEELPDENFIE